MHLVGGFKFRNNLYVADNSKDDENDGIMTITNRTRTYGLQKQQQQHQHLKKTNAVTASLSSNSSVSVAAKRMATPTASASARTTTTKANKHLGLMSMHLAVVLLVFLLADSGLNGLRLVTALKGKLQHTHINILQYKYQPGT